MSCVAARGVWKGYRVGPQRVEVLRGVDLEAGFGEVVAVVGPSGSGKSTLLHLISTVDYPDRGSIFHLGKKVLKSEEWRAKWRRHNVGVVFQSLQLIPTLTVLENVMLPMELVGMPPHKAKLRAKMLLERLGLGDKLERYPTELSGGEQQRAAVARALANSPKILVADEPASNLDKGNRRLVASIIREFADSGGCAIVSTHEEEIVAVADAVCALEGGRLNCRR
ncbi:ABC transporter related [Ignicoccus hospitalis KIN4/I]|uniref:ABC transporter related n=1 Tax=Ignicoccus hospitalis (strain KIN4/I / DSM 18386 / JCM 14125) TaxID=453591 RepID=A8ABZ4_IGNH4|nr:ABC transporter related [Ignicoccus hospitalis KIN4/I]